MPFGSIVLVSISDVHVPTLVVKEMIASSIVVPINRVDPEAKVIALI